MTVVNLNRAIVGKGWRRLEAFLKRLLLAGGRKRLDPRGYRECVVRENEYYVVPGTVPSRRSKANDAITSPAPTRSLFIVIRDAITR